jgi:tetratricopeptide (TPR) repeat protein
MNEYLHLGGVGGLASYFGSMGELAEQVGKLEIAEQFYQQAIDLLREKNNVHNLAADLTNLGRVRLVQADIDAAFLYFSEGLKLAQACGRVDVLGRAYHGLAALESARGRPDAAEAHARQALDLFRRLAMKREQAEAEALLARLGGDINV